MVLVEIPEDELGAGISVGQELRHAVSQVCKRVVAPSGSQNDHSKDELQQDAPDHRAPLNLNTVGFTHADVLPRGSRANSECSSALASSQYDYIRTEFSHLFPRILDSKLDS